LSTPLMTGAPRAKPVALHGKIGKTKLTQIGRNTDTFSVFLPICVNFYGFNDCEEE
jgi:hypothetical protein